VNITAKHHDGFCLWPSCFTEHSVASSKWRGGKGDVIAELANACRENGLWLGIYISPWDRNNPIYGKEDAAYNDYYVGQMEELLAGYGPIAEVWWDGANGDRNDPEKHQDYDWPRFIKTVRRLRPDAIILRLFLHSRRPALGLAMRWLRQLRPQWSTIRRTLEEDPSTLNIGIRRAAALSMPVETDVSVTTRLVLDSRHG
jgi:alpha-L-fucosidase